MVLAPDWSHAAEERVDMNSPSTTRRETVKALAAAPVLLTGLGRAMPTTAADPHARTSAPGDRFDFVIAGAGHNSLVCAGYLAKAGFRVLVLEGQQVIGGGCKTQEVLLPGFKEDLCSSCHTLILRNPLFIHNELDLDQYGYELLHPEVVIHFPFLDGASITIFRHDIERTAQSIAKISKQDAATFRQVAAARGGAAVFETDAGWLAPYAPPNPRLDLYFDRLRVMQGYTATQELWESRHMRAASMSVGRWIGPLGGDYGTGLQAFSILDWVKGRPIPKGGSGMLTQALGRFIEAHGGVILTHKPIVQLVIEDGKCRGVECADGSQYRGEKGVVSTIHVKHLVNMAPRELFGSLVLDGIELMTPEPASFQFHFVFTEYPKYPLAGGGTIVSNEASIMEDPTDIYWTGIDYAKGELHLDDLSLQVCHPSIFDPSRVPTGYGLLKIEGNMPYSLKEGPQRWDVIKERVAEQLLTRYMRYTTNLDRSKLLAKFLLSPIDIERMNPHMWRGGVHSFDNTGHNFAPYRLGIPGLYQTGACTAPGGSISGIPGRNTAEVVLQDQGIRIAAVAAKRPANLPHRPQLV
jgi:phytoene dehydrogenase-like protein